MINNQLLNRTWNELKNDQSLPVETKINDLCKLFSDFAGVGKPDAHCQEIKDGFKKLQLELNTTNKRSLRKALQKPNPLFDPETKLILKEIANWVKTLHK